MAQLFGTKGRAVFTATFRESRTASGECGTCGRPTRRSRYGILHRDCYVCRYLKLIYGPSISVTLTKEK